MYTSNQVATLFKIARETVRKYAIEFESHLSPTANPGENRQRAYTDADLMVFALIVEMKGQGRLYADIHASLANGQRGALPADIRSLIPAEMPRPTQLQARVNLLESQLQTVLDDNKRLTGQVEALNSELEKARRELREAYKDIGRLEQRIDDD